MVSELTTFHPFHPFPHLPDELRLLIWNLASAHPRTVTIHAHPRQIQIAEYLISPSPIPAPLHTCRESRIEALTTYTKAFHCPNNPRYIFVDFHVDTIMLIDFDLKKISAEDAGLTRWMTVEVRDSKLFCYYYMFDLHTPPPQRTQIESLNGTASPKPLVTMRCSKSAYEIRYGTCAVLAGRTMSAKDGVDLCAQDASSHIGFGSIALYTEGIEAILSASSNNAPATSLCSEKRRQHKSHLMLSSITLRYSEGALKAREL
jgi:hypothetical protein